MSTETETEQVADWCPTCERRVGIDWYQDDATGWDCCTYCSTMLTVEPS